METKVDINQQIDEVINSQELFLNPNIKKQEKYELNTGLTDTEIAEALTIKPFIYGMMIVTGKPGAGKDLFANWFTWKIRRYFANRHILRDEKPYPLYGIYRPFTPDMLWQQVVDFNKSKALVTEGTIDLNSKKGKQKAQDIEDAVENWSQTKGKEYLAYSVLYCVEFTSYLHNRRGMSTKSIAFSNIIRRWRHYPCLIVGTTQNKKELDKNLCLNFVTHDARCAWHTVMDNEGNLEEKYTKVKVYKVQMVSEDGVLQTRVKKPGIFTVHPDVPHWQLNGATWGELYETEA